MQSPPITSPRWSPRTKRTVALIALLLLALAVWWLSRILPIVIVAVLVAYLLNPVANFVERYALALPGLRRIRSRGLAVILTYLLIVALIVVILLVVVPVLAGQLEEFGRKLPDLLRALVKELERILSQPIVINGEPVMLDGKPFVPLERLEEATGTQDISQLLNLENFDLVGAVQTFLGSLGGVTGPAFSFLGDAVNALINFIFLLTMMFYLMKDGERFVTKLVDVTPPMYHSDVRRLLHELTRVWNAYLRGQLVISLITGVMIFVVGLLLGVPNALILGLFSGVLQIIPSIGPLLATLPAAFLAFVSSSSTLPFLEGGVFMLVVLLVWVVIQNFILFVVTPRLMGHHLDLHPFVVIVAVIGGASVGGALGIVLAVPFVASARVLAIYLHGKLNDREDPFPSPHPVLAQGMPGWKPLWMAFSRRLPLRLREGIDLDQSLASLLIRIRKRTSEHE